MDARLSIPNEVGETRSLQVAEKKLTEPRTVNYVQAAPNMAVIGKTYKKDAKKVRMGTQCWSMSPLGGGGAGPITEIGYYLRSPLVAQNSFLRGPLTELFQNLRSPLPTSV